MNYIKAYFIIIFLFFLCINIKAQNYSTFTEVLSSGGGESSGSNYSNFGVVGETFVDINTGGNYTNLGGFINSLKDESNPSSIKPFNSFGINIYPNPTNGTIRFESSIEIDNIEIYDMLGSLVFKSRFNSELDISNLNEGVYLLKLYTEKDKAIMTHKIFLNK